MLFAQYDKYISLKNGVFFHLLKYFIFYFELYVKIMMMNHYSLKKLLKLAEKIQKQIYIETDESIVESLKNDLRIVKSQIGNQILALPEETQIFETNYFTPTNSPNKKSFSLNQIKTPENPSKFYLGMSQEELSMKFESFLEKRKGDDFLFSPKAKRRSPEIKRKPQTINRRSPKINSTKSNKSNSVSHPKTTRRRSNSVKKKRRY